ncbi:MAG: repeat protein [Chthonomonadales bacterium]|nr:repeat protein [Chthonomonadales bacterium]
MAWIAVVPTALLPLLWTPAQAQQLKERQKANERPQKSELPVGRTDKLTAAQWQKVDAKRKAAEEAARPEVRTLSVAEMQHLSGRGPYRSKYYAGTMPWHRNLRDANLCNGNLFKSFTDIKVTGAKGAGLAMQRTYNSQDDRIGPFGQGWTHAYDIRTEEENPTTNYTDTSLNIMDRTDFVGGKQKYHRDADGLYSPPPYLYDETDAEYDKFLVNGPVTPLADIEHGMDGTIKHFVTFASSHERVCDYIQDRYGNTTNLAYTQVTVGGQTVNLLQSVTDPSGRQILYSWQNLGTSGQPAWRITQAQGPQYLVAYAYNTDFNLASSTLDSGNAPHLNRTTTYGYTSYSGQNGVESGLLASVTDALGHSIFYTYALSSITNTVWVGTITEPGSGGNIVWTLGASYSFGSVPIASSASSNAGLSIGVAVDTQLRKAWYGMGYAYLYQTTFDSANNVTVVTNHPSAWLPGQYYIAVQQSPSQVCTYGPHGNVLTQSASGDPMKPMATITYYNASQYFQKQSVTDLNGHTSTFIVGTNQGIDPTGLQTSGNGNKGSVLYVQDAGYNVNTSPSYHKQIAYSYNSNGQKLSETNLNGVVTQYAYGDAWGNLTQVIQDPHVTSGDSHLARTTNMVYDVSGHVLQSSHPSGLISTVVCDVLGEANSAFSPATANTPSETVSYSYDANGRTQSVTDNRGTTTFGYEAGNDRIATVTDPVTGTTSYTYGPAGERATMTLSGGGTWTYSYNTTFKFLGKDDPDSVGRLLTRITDDQGRGVDYWLDESGRPYMVRSNQTFDVSMNLVTYMQSAYTYDNSTGNNPSTWLTSLANTWNYKNTQGQWQQSTLVQNSYTFDNSGQRLTNQIISGGSSRTEQYGYDELNRLKTVDYGDGQTQSYTFDAMANRLSKQDSGAGTENYSFNAANMLLTKGTGSFTSDADGNLLNGGGRTNLWDSKNRMVQCINGANTSSFVYSSDGIRHQDTINGTTTDFVLDSSMFVRERNHATGANIATYLVGARGPEYRRDDATSQIRWYLYDGLGSVLGEVDPNGNITSSRKYDVYGLVRGGNSPTGTSNHKFVGQLGHPSEDNTGLIYMKARYYDPATGQFASEDPANQGYNWLIYAHANPVNRVDRDGRMDDADFNIFMDFLRATLTDKMFQKLLIMSHEAAVAFVVQEIKSQLANGMEAWSIAFCLNSCENYWCKVEAGVYAGMARRCFGIAMMWGQVLEILEILTPDDWQGAYDLKFRGRPQ